MASAEETRAEQLRKQVAKARTLRQQGLRFQTSKLPYMTRINAIIGDEVVGYLDLNPYDEKNKGREIRQVTVSPDHQRRGIASTLFNEARKMGLNPLHSQSLSSQGREFMESVGGRQLPPGERRKFDMEASILRETMRKKENKQRGRRAAIEIASQRTSGALPLRDPVALNQLKQRLGIGYGIRPAVNFGAKALGVLGLPMTVLDLAAQQGQRIRNVTEMK